MTPQRGSCFHHGGATSAGPRIGDVNDECNIEGNVMVLFLPRELRGFFIKHVIALLSVVLELTMMRRCCGVYDLGCLRVAVAAPNSPPNFVCLCQGLCAHVLLQSVCGDGGATGVRDRGERNAWANPPCAPRCYYCWLSPTLCWVDGTHLPSLWCSSCMYCASNTVPSHCVDDSLAVAARHVCA
ncbi:hypothetical protein TCDM_12509 [Trypanosoma cruzi Dm28c]|uniref:Uncharacterized protein n=2 Tax=Trypanosoma cruzi TaxID=5693 RepID=V5CKT0_TRYCR|nr:hypothetical protein TCDM_12509 [Trypanosoma cruzi Dm28c]PWU86192.1 putative retrotransposon hot spot protein (RHS,) [Trypanosoma cruzi]